MVSFFVLFFICKGKGKPFFTHESNRSHTRFRIQFHFIHFFIIMIIDLFFRLFFFLLLFYFPFFGVFKYFNI